MKATTIAIEDKVSKLLAVLDKDIRHIQDSLSCLNEMRSLVVKRDDVTLGKLLESIQAESDSYTSNESQRQSIRKELANAFGCNLEQMTLSKLEASLPKGEKAQVTKRKARLRTLIKELKKEHLSTALLLSECARFNNLLLKSIFDFRRTGTVIYNSNGSTSRSALGRNAAFVNSQF